MATYGNWTGYGSPWSQTVGTLGGNSAETRGTGIETIGGYPSLLKEGWRRNPNYSGSGANAFGEFSPETEWQQYSAPDNVWANWSPSSDVGAGAGYTPDSMYRRAQYGDLSSRGMWNLGDKNSPAWGALGGYADPSDFRGMERAGGALTGMGIEQDQWQQALAGLDPAVAQQLMQHAQGQQQVQSKKHFGGIGEFLDTSLLPILASLIAPNPMIGGAIAGAGSSAMNDGNIGDIAKGAGLGGLMGYGAGELLGAQTLPQGFESSLAASAGQPMDWSSATAGGTADTGFGANVEPAQRSLESMLGEIDASLAQPAPAGGYSPVDPNTLQSPQFYGQDALGGLTMTGGTLPTVDMTATREAGTMPGLETYGGETGALDMFGSTPGQPGWEQGAWPDATAGMRVPGEGFQYGMDDLYTAGAPALGGLSAPGAGGFGQTVKDAFKNMKDPLAIVGALGQMYNSRAQNKQLEEYLQGQQARDDMAQFPHRDFDQFAKDFMDPNERYRMMTSNPAFQQAEKFLIREQQRKLAGQGKFAQVGHGGALSNNWAVPMADVVAKNAQQWDQALFGQIKDLTGMDKSPGRGYAEMASGLLPTMMNNKNRGLDAIYEAISNNRGFLPDWLKGNLA